MSSSHEVLADSQDAFDNLVTDRTNVLDLASHYPYNPERWRIFVDGSRIFPEYASPDLNGLAQYSHGAIGGPEPIDVHTLSPNAGETVVMESAEKPRYVVQFELASTIAVAISQDLVGDDRLRVGLFDGSDGWFIEQTAAHDPARGDVVSLRGGSPVYRYEDVKLYVPTTRFARNKIQTGWYNITRQAWERSYSHNGKQMNQSVARASNDTGRGPRVGNLPIRFEITADASTTDLQMQAGSAAQVNLGTTTAFSRQKTAAFTANIGTAGAWVPLHAIRVDPRRQLINTQLVDTDIVGFSASDDVKVMPIAASVTKVDDGAGGSIAGDFATPTEHMRANSVVESTGTVGSFPDATGSVVTSAADPGGYQLGFASSYTSGQGSKTQTEGGSATEKRGLRRDDICVFLGYSETTGDVTVEYVTEQDW